MFLACGFDSPGGMEGQARRLAEGIAERGIPVTYVTTSPSVDRRPIREERGLLSLYRVPVLAAVDWATTLGILEVTALQIIGRRRQELSAIYAVQHEIGAIAVRVGEAAGLPVVLKFACGGSLGDAYTVLHHSDRDALLPAPLHPERQHRRRHDPSEKHHHAHLRRFRRDAADRKADARAGDVYVPFGLYGESRRH